MNYPAASYGVVHLFFFRSASAFFTTLSTVKPDGVDASPFKVRMNRARLIGRLLHRLLL